MGKKRKRDSGKSKKTQENAYVDVNPDPTSEEFVYDEVDLFHKSKDGELLAAGTSYIKSANNDAEEVYGVASDSDDDDEKIAEYDKMLKRLRGVGGEALDDDDTSSEEETKGGDDDDDSDILPEDVNDDELEEYEARRLYKKSIKDVSDDMFITSASQNVKKTKEKGHKITDLKITKTFEDGIPDYQKVTHEHSFYTKHLLKMSKRPLTPKEEAKAQIICLYLMNLDFMRILIVDKQYTPSHPVIGKIMELKTLLEEFDSRVESKAANKKKENESEDQAVEDDVSEYDEAERPINKTMIQNRGIIPYRKKEYKNPRVKHRLKYKKALKKRKGRYVEPRKELKKYSGEISGVNPGVVRSVKFK